MHSTADADDERERIEGKAVIVTGGTTGIGRATARLLAANGANVLICGRHQAELDDAMEGFRKLGREVHGMTADLSDREDVARLFAEADHLFGRLDVLVNNAALAAGGIGEQEDWEYIVRSNLIGYMACTREALGRMKSKGTGHIVNVGSMSADVREEGSSVYVATKSAIQGFSESLRKEVNKLGIKVSLIEPGAVGTDMQPDKATHAAKAERGEMLKAEDIAECVVFCLTRPRRCDVVTMAVRPHAQEI